ncbi:MAG TPA: 4-oxalocrotonate decarboxylase [Bacteroidetes bacterium]|nr:4-oxalocrotonate decarboxylase [Bacteroidota bacterium]
MNIKELAKKLDEAALQAKPIAQLSEQYPLTLKEAYKIQAASINRRYERGEKFVGLKLGFTSKAKMEQMGVHDLIWGRLTDAMLLRRGGILMLENFIHPRVEPELCFLVKNKIDREITLDEVKKYIVGVAPALEIIDSRYENFKFSLEDVVADNCSSAAFVIGQWHPLDLPVENLHMELIMDGEVVQSGSSKAILGNPYESVVSAARLVRKAGKSIPQGAYILAGAATPAVYLKPGSEVKVRVEKLGEAGFSTG